MMAEFMLRALHLANEALQAQEVPVGCVFVIEKKIVAESRNYVNMTRNPTRHAELNCVDTVLEYCKSNELDYKHHLKNLSVYVTVEPCIMCAAALNDIAVKEVIYGCPNDRFGGETVLDVTLFYGNSYKLSGNVFRNEAMALLKEFYKGTNPFAPEPKTKKKLKDIV